MAKITDKTAVEMELERQRAFRFKLEPLFKLNNFHSDAITESMNRISVKSNLSGVINMNNFALPPIMEKYSSLSDKAINIKCDSALSALNTPVIQAIESSFSKLNAEVKIVNMLGASALLDLPSASLTEIVDNSYDYLGTLASDFPVTVESEDAKIIKNVVSDAKTIKDSSDVSIYEKLSFFLALIAFLFSLHSSYFDDLESSAIQEFLESTTIELNQLVNSSTEYMEENTELHKADIELKKESIELDKERNELLREQNEILKKQYDPIDGQ